MKRCGQCAGTGRWPADEEMVEQVCEACHGAREVADDDPYAEQGDLEAAAS